MTGQFRSRTDCTGAPLTDCHSLFSAPAIAAMAAITSLPETRATAHPANFLSGPGKSKVWLESLSIPHLYKGGRGEGLTFPHPAQSLQGLRPIPTQTWQPCMRHVSHQKNMKANTTTLTSIEDFIIYLDWWGVRHPDYLFAVREKAGRCYRNVPRSRRGLNISIYRLACTQQQQYTKLSTLGIAVMGQRAVRWHAGSGHITIVGLMTPLRRSGFTEGFQAILEHMRGFIYVFIFGHLIPPLLGHHLTLYVLKASILVMTPSFAGAVL